MCSVESVWPVDTERVEIERVESMCELSRVECCVNYVFRAKRKGANEKDS